MTAAQHAAETVVIKAPRQMGKSSLLNRYRSVCEQAGKRFALLDLLEFADEEMADYPAFLTLLAQELWERLGQSPQAAPPRIGSQRDLTKYLERSLLAAIPDPVVIAFDEVDRVLGRAYQTNFASMLRVWHERRTARPPTAWASTGLAVVTSTEPYLFIKDVMRSPFNVGLQIELRVFNEAECGKLNRLYRARLSKSEIGQLMGLLNGHPHLTQLAFFALTGPNPTSFSSLLQKAAERDGPFGPHIRALENKLMDEAGEALLAAMKQIINDGKAPSREAFYRLQGAGLVRQDGARMVPVNQLYARFFGKM
ncbi:MAG: AAA-like domain-containing protein [Blastocatellia bacterium]